MPDNVTGGFEHLLLLTGTFGILLALLWLIKGKDRRRGGRTTSATLTTTTTPQATPAASNWWSALSKTRVKFTTFTHATEISALREQLEEACLISDLGVSNTQEVLDQIPWADLVSLPENEKIRKAKTSLVSLMTPWLKMPEQQWPQIRNGEPCVIWFVGVNGVGKTTSIAKFAQELISKGHSVMLAAGDTFRAAAGEQLETWADRLGITCIKGQAGADSSAVLFDAIQSAKSKNIQFLLCDSAGRLHNQGQLMEALSKNKRVMDKALPNAPHEILLVLDAHTGQNMISQAEHFLNAVNVTGLFLTKLDGTARGGAVVAVARKTGLPIRRLGLGESAQDLTPFEPAPFVNALVGIES